MASPEKIRLQVFLSRSGAASRRASALIIEEGRVKVNGKAVLDASFRVGETDVITLDGKNLRATTNFIYLALHKPPFYLCSNSDPEGRPLAIDLLKPAFPQRLYNVGRLDFLSSGLIFFTNDGDFAKILTHPSFELEKEYQVLCKDEIPETLLIEFKKGIRLDGENYRCKSYKRNGPRSVDLILDEGKNREIRKVFTSHSISVKRIHRIRIGGVLLKGLQSGRFRSLTSREVQSLISGRNSSMASREKREMHQ